MNDATTTTTPLEAAYLWLESNPNSMLVDARYLRDLAQYTQYELECCAAAMKLVRKVYQSVLEDEATLSQAKSEVLTRIIDQVELRRDDPIMRNLLELFRPLA